MVEVGSSRRGEILRSIVYIGTALSTELNRAVPTVCDSCMAGMTRFSVPIGGPCLLSSTLCDPYIPNERLLISHLSSIGTIEIYSLVDVILTSLLFFLTLQQDLAEISGLDGQVVDMSLAI